MYKVIKYFVDLQDGNHPYNVGDVFPRSGVEVKAERLAELAGSNNRQKVPLIAKVEDQADETADAEEPVADETADAEEPKEPAKGKRAKKTAE